MASKNEITGDDLVSKPTNPPYQNGWDLIWGQKPKQEEEKKEDVEQKTEV